MSKIFSYFLIFALFISGNNQEKCCCNDLKEGKFESYEGNKKVGIFYRKGNFQIERELKSNKYSIVKIKSDSCLFIMNSYEVNEELDTISFSVNYKKNKKGSYSFIMKPTYLKVPFKTRGSVIKVSDKIDNDEVLKILKKLNSETDH